MADLWYPKGVQRPADSSLWGITWDHLEKEIVHVTVGGLGDLQYGGPKNFFGSTNFPNSSLARFDGRWAMALHIPANRSARALANALGGVETNKDFLTQTEICAQPFVAGTDLPDEAYQVYAEYLAWLNKVLGLPLSSPVTFYGANCGWPLATTTAKQRLQGAAFDNARGLLGHQHVPENDHWDPGAFDVAKVLRLAKPATPPPPPPIPEVKKMTPKEIQQALASIGFKIVVDGDFGPASKAALTAFQAGWNPMPVNGYGWLDIDGVCGPKTEAALKLSVYTGGLASVHFRFREFACKHCGEIKVNRVLLQALEVIRTKYAPGGLGVISGYRCPTHNRDIGGATHSQHTFGTAADIAPVMTRKQCRDLKVVSGIEYGQNGRDPNRVYHVDVRHAGPYNPFGNTVAKPSEFPFG